MYRFLQNHIMGLVLISANKEAQIIDELMQKIVEKSLRAGDKLPSENVLAKKYAVPRMKVRDALKKLEERGYIYSEQGKGHYLKDRSMQIQLHLNGKTSFTEKMKQSGFDMQTHTMYCQKIDYNVDIHHKLNLKGEDGDVYKISRLRFINKEPIAIHMSYVSEARFPSISTEGSDITSMFAYYRQRGYEEFTSNKSLLSVTFPTFDEQELLCCSNTLPLIVVETNCIDEKSQNVLELSKILYRSDKFKYDIS